MCRDLQTREDGDVVNSTATEGGKREIKNSVIKKNLQKMLLRKTAIASTWIGNPPKSYVLSQTPFPHWLASPLILIGLTFTGTILITTQQNATGAGHVVTGCLEVY